MVITNIFDAQKNIDFHCLKKESWIATVPFFDVEGFDNAVDLFLYTDKKYKLKKNESPLESKIKFSKEKYAPTKEGLKILCETIRDVALQNETQLSIGNEKLGILTCFRYYSYRQKGVLKKDRINTNDIMEIKKDFRGSDGVLEGMRRHTFHNNRLYGRVNGKTKKKGSTTCRSMNKDCLCRVRMTIKIHNEGEKDGFCYMHTGIGFSSHSNHIQPGLSVSIVTSKTLSDSDKKLLLSTNEGSVPGTASRNILMHHSNQYVNNSTYYYIVKTKPSDIKCKGKGNKKMVVTVVQLHWLIG